jgi:WD40 repeat protein
MLRYKSLFYSLSVCLGIIFILSISSASAFASEKPEIFVQLGHTDFGIPGSKAVLSHTGKYLSSAGSSGAIKLWEVETGREIKTLLGHSVNLTLLAFSHDDRYLLSGSVDKTIKLWDVSAGKEIRTFTGHKDFVSYGAFSPDGKTAATSDRKEIKLWDIKTGREIKPFQGNEHFGKDFTSIYSMIFSPDGKYLVSVGNGGRIVAWEVSSGARIVKIDRDELFSGNIDNFLRFSSDGKVIISGMERIIFVDLFAKKAKIIPIKSPLIDVSQDEKYILCKDYGSTQLEIFDLNTGKKVWDLQPPSVLFEASFSPDNKFVLLYGFENILKLYDRATGNELRSFKSDVESPGSVAFSKDGKYAVVGSSVVKLWNLHKGGFDGVININKQYEQILSMYKEVEKSKDQEVAKKAEKLSEEVEYYRYASSINFHDKNNNKYYRVEHPFSNTYRINTLIFYEVPKGKFGEAIWDRKREINKFSAPAEITAYTLGDKYVLTGGKDKTIKLFEFPSGRYIRTFAGHLGEITGLTFSPDGKYILSASTDGTTRLWDISTGKEIAQFISFKDDEWVVITPEGYFNASPNGAKHLNVRVGNNVYGIDQFYAKFYRPELVQLALAGKEVPKGELITDIAAQKPAPNVQIVSPITNSSVDQDSVAVTLKITDSGGGIGSVNIYLNGAQVANDTRGIIVKGKAAANERILSFTIPLLKGQNEIRAVAFNGENSMESNPALINVTSKAVMSKPNLYALVIGINTYRNQDISLTYAVPDATAFAGTLQKVASPLFEKADIRTLTTPQATTKEAITKAFEEVRQLVKPNDLFIFYNASHGMVDVVNNEEQYFLLTSNVRLLSSQHISKDALSHKDLVQLIGSIPAQKKLVILDTCNAGKGGKEIQIALLQQTRGLTDATAVKLLQRAVGSSVFSASADSQQALEGYKGHGLFTYVLLEGLQGKADFKKDGFITVTGLKLYTEERVMTLSEEVFKRQQNPMIETGANDFPIGKLR